MKKKFLIYFLICIFGASCFCGCGKKETTIEQYSIETDSSEETSEANETLEEIEEAGKDTSINYAVDYTELGEEDLFTVFGCEYYLDKITSSNSEGIFDVALMKDEVLIKKLATNITSADGFEGVFVAGSNKDYYLIISYKNEDDIDTMHLFTFDSSKFSFEEVDEIHAKINSFVQADDDKPTFECTFRLKIAGPSLGRNVVYIEDNKFVTKYETYDLQSYDYDENNNFVVYKLKNKKEFEAFQDDNAMTIPVGTEARVLTFDINTKEYFIALDDGNFVSFTIDIKDDGNTYIGDELFTDVFDIEEIIDNIYSDEEIDESSEEVNEENSVEE